MEYLVPNSLMLVNKPVWLVLENCWIRLNASVLFKEFVPTVLVLTNFRILALIEGDKSTELGDEEKLLRSDDW